LEVTATDRTRAYWYEQSPASWKKTNRVYKFRPTRTLCTSWRRLNTESRAVYRSIDDYFPLVSPQSREDDCDFDDILRLLERLGPLRTQDELEILIRCKGDRFNMTSHGIYCRDGVEFAGKSPDEWIVAYAMLCELEGSE